jgi:hypothetical protein
MIPTPRKSDGRATPYNLWEKNMFDIKLLIDDRDQDASDAGVFERHNPLSGEVATRAAAATVADA